MSILAQRLRYIRKKHKLTQKEFGAIFGVSGPTVTRWEQGQFEPDNETIKKIAIYFNTSTDYLLGNTDDPSPPSTVEEPNLMDLKKALMEKELTWGDQKLSKEDQETLRKIILAVLEREGLL